MDKESVKLTARQQNLIAEVSSTMRAVIYYCQTEKYDSARSKLNCLLESWMIEDSTPQEWDKIYDIMHRSGANF